VSKVRQVMNTDDMESIRRETDALNQIVSQIGAAAYQQAGPAEEQPGDDGGEQPGPEGEDVVDGEYRNV
jgi:hypothetical protein